MLHCKPMSKPNVGFVGLGVMGFPMAGHLAGAGYPVSVYDIVGHAGRFAPTLVDRDNLKEYDIVGGAPTEWSSDTVYTKVTNGDPMVWWGVYAAPQDDIDTVDIRVLDELPEFTDVPITR